MKNNHNLVLGKIPKFKRGENVEILYHFDKEREKERVFI